MIPIPITGIVEDTPGDYDFLSTPYFLYQLRALTKPYHPKHTITGSTKFQLFLNTQDIKIKNLFTKKIETYFSSNTNLSKYDPYRGSISQYKDSHIKRYVPHYLNRPDLEYGGSITSLDYSTHVKKEISSMYERKELERGIAPKDTVVVSFEKGEDAFICEMKK